MAFQFLTNGGSPDTGTLSVGPITPANPNPWGFFLTSDYLSGIAGPGWILATVSNDGIFVQQFSGSAPVTGTQTGSGGTPSWSGILTTFDTDGLGSAVIAQHVAIVSGAWIDQTFSQPFNSDVQAGSAVIVTFQMHKPGFGTLPVDNSVTDSQGNVYFHVATRNDVNGSFICQVDTFAALNVEAGPLTINFTTAGFAVGSIVVGFEVTHIAAIPPTVFFQAVPGQIIDGGSSTLSWVVGGATSQSIDEGVGSIPASGSMVVSPTVSTFYHLTALNGSTPTVATAYVEVLGNEAFFSLQKIVLTIKQDKIPVRGRN